MIGMGCLNTIIILRAGEREAMIGTDTQEMGMELWDRYVMREEAIEADQVLMTVLAELEAHLLHMNVGSLFRSSLLVFCFGFMDNCVFSSN